jgi:hypothetical protein
MYNICTCMVVSLDLMDKSLILDETKMISFLASLSHPFMYGRGHIGVLEGLIELRRRPLFA